MLEVSDRGLGWPALRVTQAVKWVVSGSTEEALYLIGGENNNSEAQGGCLADDGRGDLGEDLRSVFFGGRQGLSSEGPCGGDSCGEFVAGRGHG